MSHSKGEIAQIYLGKPNQENKGHEQSLIRPCLVIKGFDFLEMAIVIPFSRKHPKHSLYTIVEVRKGDGGLTEDSYALCHQVRSISYKRIKSTKGYLTNKSLLKAQAVLVDILDL
jgi:mRNA interferase MazF